MKYRALGVAVAAASVSAMATAGTVTTDGADLVINTKGGLEVATADKQYAVKMGGRIMYDYNRAEENGVADEDQFDVRRARLYVKGKVGDDWSFKSQFNVDGGGAEDLYLRYKGFGRDKVITVGRQKMPFGLEELTSSKDISFLERSAITERYAIGRADGLQLSGASGDLTYAVAAFESTNGDANEDDFGLAARATLAPVNTDDTLVHVGLAYKNIHDGMSAVGLELAGVMGPFHAQAEFVDADEGPADADGFYIQTGWVITGEQRPYKGGKFKRIKPSGDNGAVEVVARYESGDGDYGDIELGNDDASSIGIGVNWYLNNHVKLGMTYTDGESDTSSDDGDEFRARFQLTF